MDVVRLIRELRDPAAYPHPAGELEVHQTHISVVFLAGSFAYKFRRPVKLAFLDFSTPERRLEDCRAEVRLNRRLAPDIYLGVVPLVETEEGLRLRVDGLRPGERAVEHAVRMRRLPEEAHLAHRLKAGALPEGWVERVAERLADFHREAEKGGEISRYGRFDVVASNALGNFEETAEHVGRTVSAAVHARARRRTEEALERLRPLIEARAARDVPRDTHGDLLLEHIYLFPDRDPPGDVVIVDCIEFAERFRYADPVADLAFPVMDLTFRGRPELGDRLADAWFRASGDGEGRPLLPLYLSYRAAVRAKVKGIAAGQSSLGTGERRTALHEARGHWLLALGSLEPPDRRPCLVLVGGLPGTGKSTLAGALAERAGFDLLSSDRVRKELAGLGPEADAAAPYGSGLYTPRWTGRTYRELLERARSGLREGRRVLVDASLGDPEWRRAFLDAGRALGVPVLLLLCRAPRKVALERLERRAARPGSTASDAGSEIHERMAAAWTPPTGEVARVTREVPTVGPPRRALDRALGHLRDACLAGPLRQE